MTCPSLAQRPAVITLAQNYFDIVPLVSGVRPYRRKERTRLKTMTLSPDEFMCRFLLHVLPSGFHRIRHFGLLANGGCRENLAKVRALLQVAPIRHSVEEDAEMSIQALAFILREMGWSA